MNRFKNILFVADKNSEHNPTLERAVSLAESNGARLTLIDVINEVDCEQDIVKRFDISLNQLIQDERLEYLHRLATPFQSSKCVIYTKVLVGTAFAEIVRTVQRNHYDLVIKAMTPPANLGERLLGSTDLHLLRKCPCPVWIDRPGSSFPYHKILAAVDPMGNKALALNILQLTRSLAEREQADYEIVHAWQMEGESLLRSGRTYLPEIEVDNIERAQKQKHLLKFNEILAESNINTDQHNIHLVKGKATQKIIHFGKNADLIILGTLGRAGIPGFLIGNTAEDVMQEVSCSILAVKPHGFVSPIN